MKTIFFDFDGTLTHKSSNIWKVIWQELGFDIGKDSYYRALFKAFVDKKISHQQWCDLTRDAFFSRGLDKDMLKRLSSKIHLINGAPETFKTLKEEGFSIYILSGNIVEVIEDVLGENVKYFDGIMANTFIFNNKGQLCDIAGTSYDFEGKAWFIEEYKERTSSSADDLYFVGNGGNDDWAYLSGCHTICINPDGADVTDSTKWHKLIENVDDLTQILPALNIEIDDSKER